MAGSTSRERFLGIKIKNEVQDTRFLTCLWRGSSSRGLMMREIKSPVLEEFCMGSVLCLFARLN